MDSLDDDDDLVELMPFFERAGLPKRLYWPVPDELRRELNEAVEELNESLLAAIDACMPAEADFAEYAFNDQDQHLEIYAVIDENAARISPNVYRHLAGWLKELGDPHLDYQTDRVINEEGDWGWDRTTPYTFEREHAARHRLTTARSTLAGISTAVQELALPELWDRLPADVLAMDARWHREYRRFVFVATHPHRQHPPGQEDLPMLANYFLENVTLLEVAPASATADPDVYRFVRPLVESV